LAPKLLLFAYNSTSADVAYNPTESSPGSVATVAAAPTILRFLLFMDLSRLRFVGR
jgi:hypothetical protein